MVHYLARVLRALAVITFGIGGGVGLFVLCVILVVNMNKSEPLAFTYAWKAGLVIGLIFGVLLVAVFVPLDLFARLFLAKGVYKDIFELEQVREIRMHGTPKEILAACREALLAIPHVKSVSEDSEQMVTRALTGTSWRSPGEEIEVEMNPISEGNWIVRCLSKPKSPNAVFDYGKNFENVETWLGRVKSSGRAA